MKNLPIKLMGNNVVKILSEMFNVEFYVTNKTMIIY